MTLTNNELKILAACSLDAEIPVCEIARVSGLTESAVRYSLGALEESGRLKRVTYIDVYPLGLFYFHIVFRPLAHLTNKPEVIAFLSDSPRVSYLSQTSGEFQFHMDIIAGDPFDLTEFLDNLAQRFGGIFADKRISVIESLIDYPFKFLGSHQKTTKTLGFGNRERIVEINELDHSILRHLSGNCLATTSQLARILGAKLTTVQYRLERLRTHGVIVGSRFLVDTTRLGFQLFYLHVETHGVSNALKEELYAFSAQEDAIYAILRTIGHYDFLMEAAVRSPSDIEALTSRLSDRFGGHLIKVTAQPVMQFHKISFYPLLNLPTLRRARRHEED